jgi:hypothetical protein
MSRLQERHVFRGNGMGGFLDPPSYPTHTMSLATYYGRRREPDGLQSLESAAVADYLPAAIRAEARRKLDAWERPPFDAPEIQLWAGDVMRYFRGCYRGEGEEPECWHVDKLRIGKGGEPGDHAGVHLIRKFYPETDPATLVALEGAPKPEGGRW